MTTPRMIRTSALLVGLLLVALPAPIRGQSTTTDSWPKPEIVSGVLWDVFGTPVSSAYVLLTPVPPTAGATQELRSGSDGTFSFSPVPWGTYRLSAAMPGYSEVNTTLSVGVGGVTGLPLVLPEGYFGGDLRQVKGKVENSDGPGQLGTTIVVYDLNGRLSGTAEVDRHGRFVVQNLHDKPYLLVALGPGVAGSTVVPDGGSAASLVTIRIARVASPPR